MSFFLNPLSENKYKYILHHKFLRLSILQQFLSNFKKRAYRISPILQQTSFLLFSIVIYRKSSTVSAILLGIGLHQQGVTTRLDNVGLSKSKLDLDQLPLRCTFALDHKIGVVFVSVARSFASRQYRESSRSCQLLVCSWCWDFPPRLSRGDVTICSHQYQYWSLSQNQVENKA